MSSHQSMTKTEQELLRSQVGLHLQIILVFILSNMVLWSNKETLDGFTVAFIRPGSLAILVISIAILYYSYRLAKNLVLTKRWYLAVLVPLVLSLSVWNLNIDDIKPFEQTTVIKKTITADPSMINERTQAIEQVLLSEINTLRQEEGLNPLINDKDLAHLALLHSLDQAQNNYIAHENKEGEGPTDRAEKLGISIRRSTSVTTYVEGIGENIGTMPIGEVRGIGEVTNDPNSIAKAQVTSWMQSFEHRENILSDQYAQTGIGIVFKEENKTYIITQNFR